MSGTVSGTASSYLWDRLAPYPTLVDDGAFAYIHGAGPQAQIDPSGNRTYLLGDALSWIRGLTDGSGTLVGTTAYDAFGAPRTQSGLVSAFGYSGEQYTPATGLLHLRARDLNPALGRFLSADPGQAAILVGLIVSLPAAVTLSGPAVVFLRRVDSLISRKCE
ncbi:MAG: RHS repeat-associated core domain-containing protein [Caldilineaceae bacterium]